jgi:pimeloyl-ACP methyl ester carboxylesterase
MVMWEVAASVYGDLGQTSVNLDDIDAMAGRLNHAANRMETLGNIWSCALMQITSIRSRSALCPVLTPDSPGIDKTAASWNRTAACGTLSCTAVRHTTLNVDAMLDACSSQAVKAHELGLDCRHLANALWDARSLYSNAEHSALMFIGQASQAFINSSPAAALVGGLLVTGGSLAYGTVCEGRFNSAYAIAGSAWAHEGVFAALGQRIARIPAFPTVEGLVSSDESNHAAARLSPLAGALSRGFQGEQLVVNRIEAEGFSSPAVHSVDTALEHLDELGNGLNSGLPHSTICIQRYRLASGERSWLVTIPGTQQDGSSPLGWAQNVQLMSSEDSQRMEAASARFVLAAMSDAGIHSRERVVLVGHSQGGLVAAAIASQQHSPYRIEHIVTAGSPVANHPIPASTWVTSVEMEDELVAALDGSANPERQDWITVRGSVRRSTSSEAEEPSDRTTPVTGSADTRESSHGMNYHRAAWRNADELGAVETHLHNLHLGELLDGTLEENLYFQGELTP